MGVSAVGAPRSFPNQSATNFTSTGLAAVDFGFEASYVRVVVDVGTVYLNLDSTVGSTGTGFKATSGETHDFYRLGVSVHGLGIATTSTAPTGRIGAWG